VFLIILHFVILSHKISFFEEYYAPDDAVFASENEKKNGTAYIINKDNKTDVYIKYTGSDSGSSKPIILGYYKFNKEIFVIVASKSQLSSNGGFAAIQPYLFLFTVYGEYNKVTLIEL
jgi:hypothetical protein